MKPVNFREVNKIYGENQKEYIPLPVFFDTNSLCVSCWKMTLKEKILFLFTNKIFVGIYTFHKPLQPIYLTISKKELIKKEFKKSC
jgi:hypothetical protein